MASSSAAGGGAAAVIILTLWSKGPLLAFRGVDNKIHHNWCTAKMSNTIIGNGRIDAGCGHPAQTDAGPCQRGKGPRKHQPLQWNIGRVHR